MRGSAAGDPSRPLVHFSSGGIDVVIDPADGGRITSLRAHEREWLAPSTPRAAGITGFVEAGTGGWDEAAPTVRACGFLGRELPDHGDAWRRPWTPAGPDTLSVVLDSVGVRLTRALRATTRGVALEYTATAEHDVPLLWSAHPLFAAPPGTRVIAGRAASGVAGVAAGRAASGVAAAASAAPPVVGEYPGADATWPEAGAIDAVPDGRALKVFATTPLRSARVVHADGAAIELSWNVQHVGFYWDRGEFSEVPVLAVEPCTGRGDAADEAARVGPLPVVAPGHPLIWRLEVALVAAAAP